MKSSENFRRAIDRRSPKPNDFTRLLTSAGSAARSELGSGQRSKKPQTTFSTCARLVQFSIRQTTKHFQRSGQKKHWSTGEGIVEKSME